MLILNSSSEFVDFLFDRIVRFGNRPFMDIRFGAVCQFLIPAMIDKLLHQITGKVKPPFFGSTEFITELGKLILVHRSK